MDKGSRSIIIIIAVVAVLAILAYSMGLFGEADAPMDAGDDIGISETMEPGADIDSSDLVIEDDGVDVDVDITVDDDGVDLPDIEVETTVE